MKRASASRPPSLTEVGVREAGVAPIARGLREVENRVISIMGAQAEG